MTVVCAESPGDTGDPDAVDTRGSVGVHVIGTSGLVNHAAGEPPSEPYVGPSDAAAPPTRARAAELTARFKRDAIPLRAPLYRRAMRMTHNRADAEDLLQDTMMSAYAGFGSFRPGTNLNAWIYRIQTNAFINTFRKRQRQPVTYSVEEITDQLLAATAAHSSLGLPSAEDEVLATLPDAAIVTAMNTLPEPFRMAVYLADVEGLKYKEIAEIMDIPHGTVMSRLHRGRRQLRSILADVDTSTTTTDARSIP